MFSKKQIIELVALGLLLFFIYPMAAITMQYIPYQTDVGFLRIKQQYIHIDFWRNAFFVHVYCSMLVLLAGFTQFSTYLLKHYNGLHRKLGYLYVVNILVITGPASLVMGFYAHGGTVSRVAFVLLSCLWWLFTYISLMAAKRKHFTTHRIFMIRSFALTLSAITLRCWKVVLQTNTNLTPYEVYQVIAWLGWVLNLLLAELYIAKFIKRSI